MKMKNEDLREKIIERAYDIVKSEKYSYRGYTGYIINSSLTGVDIKPKLNAINRLHMLRNRLSERRFWNTKKSERKHALAAS
jgi:hypothetical protein